MQPNVNIDAMFAGMENAEMMGGGQYIKGEGRFLVEAKEFKVSSGYKGTFLHFEFSILESTSPEDPAGATRSKSIKWDTKNPYAFSDAKAIAFALLGTDPAKAPAPSADPQLHKDATDLIKGAVADAGNDVSGIRLRLETNKKGTKAGGVFTVHTWKPDT